MANTREYQACGDAVKVMTDTPDWRCDITGNPVGTDTRMIGAGPCNCQGCRAARAIAAMREVLERIDGQAVCVGMDGPEGDARMLQHIHEIAETALSQQDGADGQ